MIVNIVVSYKSFLNGIPASRQESLTVERRQLLGKCAKHIAKSLRQLHILFKIKRLSVIVITAEKLVCALTRKHNLYLLRSKSCEEIQRYCRGIRKRLVHIVLYHRRNLKVFLCGNLFCVIPYALMLCKFNSPVKLGVLFLGIAYREGPDIVSLCHFMHNIA